ncbi:MAG TPA: glycosyltransferase, partial [Terriglobus sp.]
IPTLAYEPNAVPGMVNRFLGKRVSAAAVAFEETRSYFRNAEVTGVPVRTEIFQTGSLVINPSRLLVTAGSNGAKVFNDTLPLLAADLLAAVPGLTILHQTGERAFAATEAAYQQANLPAGSVTVQPFVKDMPQQLDRATLVLARSGSTVAELAAAGRPALLVPFPQAADDHQTKNALAMVRIGAAEMLPQAQLTPDILRTQLIALLTNSEHLQQMGHAARSAAKPHALEDIGNRIAALAK